MKNIFKKLLVLVVVFGFVGFVLSASNAYQPICKECKSNADCTHIGCTGACVNGSGGFGVESWCCFSCPDGSQCYIDAHCKSGSKCIPFPGADPMPGLGIPGTCVGSSSSGGPPPPVIGCIVNNDCEPCSVCRITNNHGECVLGGNCVNDSNCGQNGICEKNPDDEHVCECRYLSNEERCAEKCQPDSTYEPIVFLSDNPDLRAQCNCTDCYYKLLDTLSGPDRYCCCKGNQKDKK